MPGATVWLAGLPAPYDGTSTESIRLYIKDVCDFLSSPVVRLICQCHPNHIALLYGPPSSIFPDGTFSSWWSYFDALGVEENHMLSVRSAFSETQKANSLKKLVSSGTLPDAAPTSLKDFIRAVEALQLNRTSEHFPTIYASSHDYSRESNVTDSSLGMSPKKSHEVSRLSSLIRAMKLHCSDDNRAKVIDVGSGQGYLSYEIANSAMEVLALESDQQQLDGARKRAFVREARRNRDEGGIGASAAPVAPVTFRHAHISNTGSLKAVVDDWVITTSPPTSAAGPDGGAQEQARPAHVIFTGLHACGSLTPAVLRAFTDLANSNADRAPRGPWHPSALALVGCCYNLLQPFDFPMSRSARDSNLLKLHVQHLQLACQCPIQWALSHDTWKKSRFARRKIVYRALLGRVVSRLLSHSESAANRPSHEHGWTSDEDLLKRMEQSRIDSGDLDEGRAASGSATLAGIRLGRLNAQQYEDWPTFLRAALNRLITRNHNPSSPLSHLKTLDIEKFSEMTTNTSTSTNSKAGDRDNLEETETETEDLGCIPPELPARLACLHVLRAMIGPVIESLIIADRVLYLVENLQSVNTDPTADEGSRDGGDCDGNGGRVWCVSVFNLFALESGSARNVVITAGNVRSNSH